MRTNRRPLALMLSLIVILAGAPLAVAAPTPSVRIFAAKKTVTQERWGKRTYLDLGLWAAPVGGDFELRVKKPDYYSAPEIVQVDSITGKVLRTLPPEILNGWSGLADFTEIVFFDAEGAEVTRTTSTFCPNAWNRQRLSDEGRNSPRYPQICSSYSPFIKGMVWGIDEHWASSLLGGSDFYENPSVRVPDGTYTVTVTIADSYRELFEIAEASSSVTLEVTIVKGEREGRKRFDRLDQRSPQGAPQTGVPTMTDPDPSLLPDLVALPGWGISVRNGKNRSLLSFGSTPWNAGPAPLIVEGFRSEDNDYMDAYQYFSDASGKIVGRAPVGTLDFDTRHGHNHWHFEQFARYTLLSTAGDEVVRSKKQSFCIVPTDAIDLTVPGANWTQWGSDSGTQCGDPRSMWVRERLDPGWGDTYYQSVGGQAFNITDVPNGWYLLKVEVNALGTLYQSDDSNDTDSRLLRLRGTPGNRKVLVTPWNGMEV